MGISLVHASTKTVGDVGENVCCRFLIRHGYRIVVRNYRKKWGELDIVAFKDGVVHFFEVKSVTFVSKGDLKDGHVPEENVHPRKIEKISRTVRTFLAERFGEGDVEFSFHVLCVFLDIQAGKARIKWIKNIIL